MRIQRISENDFAGMKDAWQTLLAKSQCDPLFLSWGWMYTWWQLYGQRPDYYLEILAAYDEQDTLVGIAPLYIQYSKLSGTPFYINSVLFIGTVKRSYSGFLTENLEFILDTIPAQEVADAFFAHIIRHIEFDEFYLSYMPTDTLTYQSANAISKKQHYYRRVQYSGHSYCIDTDRYFNEFLASLGKNTRLKIFNRRKNLEKLGAASVQIESDFAALLQLLSGFHESRWHKKFTYSEHLKFITSLISRCNTRTTGVILLLDNQPIACTVDLVCEGKAYNLQQGFEDYSQHKIAAGSLAQGFAIESYCENTEINRYDLLVGEGKNSNYKELLTKDAKAIETLQLLCTSHIKIIYKLRDIQRKISDTLH